MKGSHGTFTGVFGSNNDDKKIQSFLNRIMEPDIKMEVGRAVKLDSRTIYPIIEIVTIKNANNIPLFAEIYPFALVIEEDDQKYVINLTEDEIDSEKVMGMI